MSVTVHSSYYLRAAGPGRMGGPKETTRDSCANGPGEVQRSSRLRGDRQHASLSAAAAGEAEAEAAMSLRQTWLSSFF